MEGRFGPETTILAPFSLVVKIHTIGRVFFEYIRLLIAPVNLHIDAYYERMIGIQREASIQSVAGLTLLLFAFFALFFFIWRVVGKQRVQVKSISDKKLPSREVGAVDEGVMALGLTFFLIYLFPVSHIIPFGALMAERFLYAPSFGFVLLGVAACRKHVSKLMGSRLLIRVASLAGLTLICGLLGLKSYSRASQWHDPVSLWTPVERQIKDDYRVYNNLAVGYSERKNHEKAIQMLERCLEIKPDHAPALNNLGYLYMKRRRHDDAEKLLISLVGTQPQYYLAWNSLGVIAAQKGKMDKALHYFQKALEINPNYRSAQRNITIIQGKKQK